MAQIEPNRDEAVTIATAESVEDARRLLLAATPPNSSYTQLRNFSAEQIDRALLLGFRKPQWVWIARNELGATLGVAAGWGSEQRQTPFVLDFFDLRLDRPAVVRSLLDRVSADCAEPGRATLDLIYFLPAGVALGDPKTRDFIGGVEASGFRPLVRRHRYRLEIASDPVSVPGTQLRFEAAESADDPRLRTVMADILVGSLDAHDVAGLQRADVATIARETIAEYVEMDPVESMFLAYDSGGELVGLVIGGLRGSGASGSGANGTGAKSTGANGTASFIGVSHRHRGHGYAAQLLGFITQRMIDEGAAWIIGETDYENFPMAAAFTKVGYPTSESRLDFVRALSQVTGL